MSLLGQVILFLMFVCACILILILVLVNTFRVD